ncbi:MAG: prepilin peptidase [bacterium]|nr:prepilin peptidase [bacterium]
MTFFAAAVLGAILGSFINALSFRYNTGRSIVRGRSRCMHCGHTLEARDLVPIFSYLCLRGHCRLCGTHISAQYPLVEVAAAALSLGVYILYPTPLYYTIFLLVWLVILFIVVYDLRHTVIPWPSSGLLALLAFASLFLFGVPTLPALLAGPLLALPLFLLSLVSAGRWMGWGDSAFELSLGWLLGATAGLSALALAVWSGALVGVMLMSLSKWCTPLGIRSTGAAKKSFFLSLTGFTMNSEIPFAPFLALGAALVFFFHVDFLSTLSALW